MTFRIGYPEYQGKLETDPLPDEIARRAAEIRATWDADEELRRREQPILPWSVPTVTGRAGIFDSAMPRGRSPHSE
jgi:hypothetical protein